MNGLEMKYFVLNPNKRDTYGLASRKAIMAYAEVVEKKNKQLAEGLRNWVLKIQLKNAGYKI